MGKNEIKEVWKISCDLCQYFFIMYLNSIFNPTTYKTIFMSRFSCEASQKVDLDTNINIFRVIFGYGKYLR